MKLMKSVLMPSAYEKFVEQYAIKLNLTDEQSSQWDNNQPFSLSTDQVDHVVDQLTVTDGVEKYLLDNISDLLPVSVSLFVLNDRLWKMMERKPWDTDKMLAMTTIPLCTWEQKEEKTSNPKAVKRWEIRSNTLTLDYQNGSTLQIKGEGGDFSGFIEQSQLTMRKFGMIDSRGLVPNYTFEQIRIDVDLQKATLEIHPSPREDLDYDYSEHARVFYEYGFSVTVPGEKVTLTIGKRKPAKMFGEVYLLVGSRIENEDDHYRALKTIIWLHAFKRHFNGR